MSKKNKKANKHQQASGTILKVAIKLSHNSAQA
jgi:hypothetical protein